jgi:hypothetical protein
MFVQAHLMEGSLVSTWKGFSRYLSNHKGHQGHEG